MRKSVESTRLRHGRDSEAPGIKDAADGLLVCGAAGQKSNARPDGWKVPVLGGRTSVAGGRLSLSAVAFWLCVPCFRMVCSFPSFHSGVWLLWISIAQGGYKTGYIFKKNRTYFLRRPFLDNSHKVPAFSHLVSVIIALSNRFGKHGC